MSDNRTMCPSIRRSAFVALLCCLAATGVRAQVEAGPAPGSLRELFPPSSFQSNERADAAIAATSGAKSRVEKQYRVEARDCAATFLVNACLDQARARQRLRLGEIDAVELEANRFKRRDKADRIEAERAKREADRTANAGADAEQRARNRQTYDDKQSQRAREMADQAHSAGGRAGSTKPHRPAIRIAKPDDRASESRQRAKNAADHAVKVAEAETHKMDIERRVAAKTADRKRRDDEKKARDAKAAMPVAVPSRS